MNAEAAPTTPEDQPRAQVSQQLALTRAHRILIAVVVTGAVIIAGIGFAGSYAAVRDLAAQKGFGTFAHWFPIGMDAGIVVLLALDLLLTWVRIPFPLLRQTAWLLTTATIAFNAAAAWGDPLAVGMHAVIPVLFVVTVEAARHAVGRIADITADKHMEGVRISRWLLAFPSTFRLWRRMKLWELRSYDEVIRLEQERLVYRARLRADYGRGWRRKAPVEALMPLKLARYGRPVTKPAPAFDAAARDALDIAGPIAPALPATLATNAPDAGAPAPITAPEPAAPVLASASAPALTSPDVQPPHSVQHAPEVPPRPTAPAPGTALVLDLAKMRDLHPDVRTRENPPGERRTGTQATDADLIARARALTGPVSMRRLQREFGIGQARATRIRRALDAPAPDAPESDRQDAS